MDLLSLPSEIIYTILSYLPIYSLLTLARTNKGISHLALCSLTQLHLIAVPKPLHTTLTKLDLDTSIYDPDHLINLNLTPDLARAGLSSRSSSRCSSSSNFSRTNSRSASSSPPPSPSTSQNTRKSARHALLTNLSTLLTTTLLTPSLQLTSLQTLSVQTWSPTPTLLSLLSTSPHLSSLRHLTLNFSHPTHHHPCLPPHYWTHPDPPSPGWDSISGLGPVHSQNLRLCGLETLSLHRAGVTSAQLQSWIRHHPRLKKLCLFNVSGVDEEFLRCLARRAETESCERQLQKLEMADCTGFDDGNTRLRPVVSDDSSLEKEDDHDDDDHNENTDSDSESSTRPLNGIPSQRMIYKSLATLAQHGLHSLTVKRCPGIDGRQLIRLDVRWWHLENVEVDDHRTELVSMSLVEGVGEQRVLEVDDDTGRRIDLFRGLEIGGLGGLSWKRVDETKRERTIGMMGDTVVSN